MNVQRFIYSGSRSRNGLMLFAPLFAVAIMVMLAACPSGDNNGGPEGLTATAGSADGTIDLRYTVGSTDRLTYVVLSSNDTAPTDYDTIVAATGAGTANGEQMDVAGTGSAVSVTVSGLRHGRPYAVYWVIRDSAGTESAVTRTPDSDEIIAPTPISAELANVRFTAATAGAGNTDKRFSAQLTNITGAPTTAYYSVYPSGATPTHDNVKLGSGGTLSPIRGFATNRNISPSTDSVGINPISVDIDIPAGSAYEVYVVLTMTVGAADNLGDGDTTNDDDIDSELLTMTVTAALPEPPTATVGAVTLTAGDITIPLTAITEPLVVYWAVYAGNTATAPSIDDIRIGTGAINGGDASGNTIISPISADGNVTGSIPGAALTAGTAYDIYVVLRRGNSALDHDNTRLFIDDVTF